MAEPAESSHGLEIAGSPSQWAFALLFSTVFLSHFYEIVPPVRYLKYSVLPIVVLLYIGSLKDVRRPVIFIRQYSLPFLILLAAYAVSFPRINFSGIKDMLFIACFLAFFIFFGDRKVNTRLLNAALVGVYAVQVFWSDHGASTSLISSGAFSESILSLVFGMFAVFTLLKKQYFWFLINAVALFLSLKRIALLGLLAVLLVLMLPQRLRKIVTHPVVAVSMNLLAVGLLLAVGHGAFDQDRFGISIHGLFMGRNTFYAQASDQVLANPLMIGLFGAGPGSAYDTLGVLVQTLHSDVLKIFYELGAIWFVVFFYALYATSNVKLRLLALYLNVVFLTDNALIYVDVMAFYMILAAQLSLPDSPVGAPVRKPDKTETPAHYDLTA